MLKSYKRLNVSVTVFRPLYELRTDQRLQMTLDLPLTKWVPWTVHPLYSNQRRPEDNSRSRLTLSGLMQHGCRQLPYTGRFKLHVSRDHLRSR